MRKLIIPVLAFVVMAAIACNKNNNSATHNVTVRLTDNPVNAQEVNVEIKKVVLRYADQDTVHAELDNVNDTDNVVKEDDTSNCVTIKTEDKVYNLLDLQNGVNTVLAQGPVTHDHLKEIRFILGTNNTIKVNDQMYPLFVPSGTTSGFKIKIGKHLVEGNNDFLIDFDAALSIHQTGNGQYILRPVLRLK